VRAGSGGGAAVGRPPWRARWPGRTGVRPGPWPGRTGGLPGPVAGPNRWPAEPLVGRARCRAEPVACRARCRAEPLRRPKQPVAGGVKPGTARRSGQAAATGRCGARSASPAAGLGPPRCGRRQHTRQTRWHQLTGWPRHSSPDMRGFGDSSPEMHGLMPGLGGIVRDRGVISRCGHDRGWTAGQATGPRRRVAAGAGGRRDRGPRRPVANGGRWAAEAGGPRRPVAAEALGRGGGWPRRRVAAEAGGRLGGWGG
jgi:hypothetical protein